MKEGNSLQKKRSFPHVDRSVICGNVSSYGRLPRFPLMKWLSLLKARLLEWRPQPPLYVTPAKCFWLRVAFVIVTLLFSFIGPAILTLEVLSKYYLWVTSYDKFQGLPWEVHVVNINPDMIREENTTFRCRGTLKL
jgi:hypothetical protein